ncbi:MAG: TetR/AcrR family transcriptional regulator [Armatimonadetes bacterium]|nr:TetR/AcrR family transcriptional regulator [Armatimonadota bacterium]
MNDIVEQPQSSLRERRKQHLREELLSVAMRLFRENGIDSTSVDDIVRAAGVATGTFYLYFKVKADVVKEAVDALFAEMESRVAQAISLAPEDARVTLRAVVKAHLAFLQENQGMAPMLLSGRKQGTADMDEDTASSIRARSLAATVAVYERIIRTGMLQTHFREVDAGLAAHALQGILTGLAYRALDSGETFAGIDCAALELLEKGIKQGI